VSHILLQLPRARFHQRVLFLHRIVNWFEEEETRRAIEQDETTKYISTYMP
jgi:hypothetical protein